MDPSEQDGPARKVTVALTGESFQRVDARDAIAVARMVAGIKGGGAMGEGQTEPASSKLELAAEQ